MASAADVPSKYDVVINGQGYTFMRTLDGTYLSSNRHRAEYSYSKTFIERSNIQGDYGDNQQDFWLTATQRDWSLGEQQKFFRGSDSSSIRRYYRGTNVDVRIPGQVSMRKAVTSTTFAGSIVTATSGRAVSGNPVYAASATNLYEVAADGTITDRGAHGLGAAPASPFGLACDTSGVYLTSTAGGSVGIRRWNGSAFSTWSSQTAISMAFLNNALYSYDGSSQLYRHDTSGVATSVYQWKDAAGAATSTVGADLVPYGGKLAILRWHDGSNRGSEMWLYDGTGAFRAMDFPYSFFAYDIEEAAGILFIGGSFIRPAAAGGFYCRPAVWFFQNGTTGLLWQADDYSATEMYASVAAFDGGVIWNDDTRGELMYYDLGMGGVQSIGGYTVAGSNPLLVGWTRHALYIRGNTTGYVYPSNTTATSSTIIASQFDFDSSLTKIFRGVTVDFDSASDGNGGTVDVDYQVGSTTGSWTSLATGVTSGSEVLLPTNVTGRSLGVRITLNKGTSTDGPVLKRLYVRAAPELKTFRIRAYNLDLTSTPELPTELQDGSVQPLSGHEQAANLNAAISSAAPITITDRFGTYTGVLEPENCSILELHSDTGGGKPGNSGQFIAVLTAREI